MPSITELPAAPTAKRCGTCGDTKALENFAFKNKARGTRVSKCKPCQSEYNRLYHEANRTRVNPKIHATARSHRERLTDMADQLRHTLACSACGRDRAAGADINLVPPKELTGGRRLSEIIRAGWSAERFTSLLEATVADPAGLLCRRCLGRQSGLDQQAAIRAAA